MRFESTRIPGVLLVHPDRHTDERGSFARTWDASLFGKQGLTTRLAQCSVSTNPRRGTLRGMHYQVAPHREAKLVRCTRGGIFDVAVDLRPESETFCEWVGVALTPKTGTALYIPEGCAHGFLTLTDDTHVFYMISAEYAPKAGRGVRYDDPAFGIDWPEPVRVIKERDASYPDFDPSAVEFVVEK